MIASRYDSRCFFGTNLRTVLPIIGVRPCPPPARISKPTSPSAFRCMMTPMSWDHTAVRALGRGGDGDLELARQEREFRVQGRPLADDLGVDARILDLVGGDAGVLVG